MDELKTLRGLNVLVTGAASGIGRQLSRDLFWQERCNLLLLDRNRERLELLKDELSPHTGTAPARGREEPWVKAIACDVSSAQSVQEMAAQITPFGVDVLVNNAGIAHIGPFEKMQFEDFARVVEVNLLGTVRVTHALLPKLLESPRPFIVNLASLAGLLAAPGMCAYATSKAGIVGFSSTLALEFEGRVGVATICPSFVKTDIAQHALLSEGAIDAGRAETAGAMNAFLSVVGSNPRKTSDAVIRAIKKNKRLVLVNPDAYLLYYTNWFFPGLSNVVVTGIFRQLTRLGIID